MSFRNRLTLTLLLLVAPLFACDDDDPEEKHCTDEKGTFVDDSLCDSATGTWQDGGTHAHAGGVRPFIYYHYVYVPHSYYGGVGTPAASFHTATTPGSGHAIAGTSRGGFGSSGSSHAATGVSRGGFGGIGAGHAGGGA